VDDLWGSNTRRRRDLARTDERDSPSRFGLRAGVVMNHAWNPTRVGRRDVKDVAWHRSHTTHPIPFSEQGQKHAWGPNESGSGTQPEDRDLAVRACTALGGVKAESGELGVCRHIVRYARGFTAERTWSGWS
jgi:hypothetical protein